MSSKNSMLQLNIGDVIFTKFPTIILVSELFMQYLWILCWVGPTNYLFA